MGYYSTWEGHVSIEPSYVGLVSDEVDDWLDACGGKLVTVVTAEPAFIRQFSTTLAVSNHEGITFNSLGEQKAYNLSEAVTNLVNWFNDNSDSILNGQITVYGEDSTDIWRLHIRDGLISRENAIIRWADGTEVESNY